MVAVVGRVEDLVEHVVARRDQACRQESHDDADEQLPARVLAGLHAQRNDDTRQNEHVLDPVIDTRDPEMPGQRRPGRLRGRLRPGCSSRRIHARFPVA